MRVEELQLLRNEDLLSLARNQVADCRKDAIRLLVERGSHLATHPDIASEAESLVYSEPLILKKTDPAAEVRGRKLPGFLEVLAKEADSARALEQRASVIESNLTETARGLHGKIDEKESFLKQKLADAKSDLYRFVQESVTEADTKRAGLRSEILSQLSDLVKKNEAYVQQLEKAEARISHLERALGEKFMDWIRGR